MNREMKDSGIPWIGEIPKEWEIKPLKYVLNKRNEKNKPIKSKERLSLSIDIGITKYEDKTTNLDRFKDDFEQYQLAYPNDIVLNSMNMIVGAVGKSNYFGCVSPVYYVMTPLKGSDPDYYGYLLNVPSIRKIYHKLGKGIYAIERGEGRVNTCRLKVPFNDFGRINIPFPRVQEQKAIAEFLDKRCGEIDELISLQERMVDELKEYKQSVLTEAVTKGLNPNAPLKDSGIEWIGEIPEHWKVSKIKYIGEARNGLTYSPQEMCDEAKGTLVLRSSNIQNDKLCFEDNVYVDKEVDEELMMKEGDILICSRNGSAKLVGKCAIIPKHVTATFGAFMMRFRSILNRKFSLYLIRTTLAQYKEFFSTSTINQLTNTMIGNMQVPLPSENEQQEIADFLDEKCSEIDSLIALKQTKIEELKDYKKSIIYEYVTGKKEVLL